MPADINKNLTVGNQFTKFYLVSFSESVAHLQHKSIHIVMLVRASHFKSHVKHAMHLHQFETIHWNTGRKISEVMNRYVIRLKTMSSR